MNKIGLPVEETKVVVEHLDKYLADLHVLYIKLHNYHWNVEGPEFFTLHAYLEELYDSVAVEIDEIAERILMIGHRPSASLAQYLEKARLQETNSVAIRGNEIAEQLLADYGTLVSALRTGIEAAQDGGDEVTADLLIGNLAGYEKTMWMLSAYLNK